MPRRLLSLEFTDGWSLKELSEFLGALRGAYGAIVEFERSAETQEDFSRRRHLMFDFPGPVLMVAPFLSPERERDPDPIETALLLDGEPAISKIQIASPGLLEIIGSAAALTAMLSYIKWRANNDLRREKESLENLLLQNKVVKQRIDLLRDAGVPKREIRKLLHGVAEPMRKLDPFIREKEIEGAVRRLPGKADDADDLEEPEAAPVSEDPKKK